MCLSLTRNAAGAPNLHGRNAAVAKLHQRAQRQQFAKPIGDRFRDRFRCSQLASWRSKSAPAGASSRDTPALRPHSPRMNFNRHAKHAAAIRGSYPEIRRSARCQRSISSQCPAVESVPGKVRRRLVLKGTRMPVSGIFENPEAGANIDDIMSGSTGSTVSKSK